MIVPFEDIVVIEIPKGGSEIPTAGGILLISSEETPDRGTLTAKGTETKLPIEVGDTLFIRTYGWQNLVEGGKEYLVGKEEGILGKL